jgi:hypothetical protein
VSTGGPMLPHVQAAITRLHAASLPAAAGAEEMALGVGVEILAGRLFESISMQLSVALYFAEYTVRGANLDSLRLVSFAAHGCRCACSLADSPIR